MAVAVAVEALSSDFSSLVEGDPSIVHDEISNGVPFSLLEEIAELIGVGWQNLGIDVLGISARTLTRRRRDGRFSSVESDRVYRTARVVKHALEVFETTDAVARFFQSPSYALGGVEPIEYLATDIGSREVDNVLGHIEHGMPL